jgi:hypothetical protein
MAILVQSLINDARVLSDTVNNFAAITDPQVATLISDAGSELDDIFTAENQHYAIATFDFTLSGGPGDGDGINSKLLPVDFQQAHGLELNPATAQPISIKGLDNWLDRNQGNNYGALIFAGGMAAPRNFALSGNLIKIFPVTNSAGAYRLYYKAMFQPLMIPLAVPQAVPGTPATINGIVTGTGVYSFAGSAWSSVNVGDTLIVTGAANAANNGSFAILNILTPTSVTTSNAASVGEGAGASALDQPVGTIATLPTSMNSWALYMKTHAAMAIKMKREEPCAELAAKLEQLKARIMSILQNRNEDPSQPPLTRNWGSFGGIGGFGGY